MDEIYGSVMSFGKLPCTPVSGAYASFYDVFGDVERIGTGSSSSEDQAYDANHNHHNSARKKDRMGTSKHASSCDTASTSRSSLCSDYCIDFLQQKQQEILGALHEEVRVLKHENAELKFQIHVILQQREPLLKDGVTASLFQTKLTTNIAPVCTDNTNGMIGQRERTLELEFESATKMIQELKWVQQHYEKKIRLQETRIEELERQLQLNNNENAKVIPVQVPSAIYQTMKPVNTSSHGAKSSRQRSSSVTHQRDATNRRNSLQSILPDDYKSQVATLPPILNSALTTPNSISIRNAPLLTAPSALGIPNKNNASSSTRTKKSSFVHSSNPSLARTNTPAFVGDKASQHNGEAHLYFSK